MIKNVLNLDHNQNFASERAHLRRKIGGTKRWGMLSAYRGCCSALLSFNHSIHKRSQVFHKTLPSGEEANLPVVTTVSLRAKMSCLFYTPKKKTKKTENMEPNPGYIDQQNHARWHIFVSSIWNFVGVHSRTQQNFTHSNMYGYLGLHIS